MDGFEIDGVARLMPGAPHAADGHPLAADWYELDPPLPDEGVKYAILDARGFFSCNGQGILLDGSHRLCKRRGLTSAEALRELGIGYRPA
ncbi:hypothetical protein [Nocardia sp. CDC160]|uniref:hypothetical protein n=1 Tax=Nocardia sp. CDC160 TaxID=3112166 RepID=UPI002DB64828|nr:hypothetical protein [Nocardia sp. CDC160]MEC3919249.1 hypothetical protein [Nocardia sp. CDC160]